MTKWQAFRLVDAFKPKGYMNMMAVKTGHPKFWLELPIMKYGKKLPIDTICCISCDELEYVIERFIRPDVWVQKEAEKMMKSQGPVLLTPKSYYWEVHGKHYVTMGWGQTYYFGYHLAEAISDIESLTGISIVREKEFDTYYPLLDYGEFEKKIESEEIKAFYINNNGGHTCYDEADIIKCCPRCLVCSKYIVKNHNKTVWNVFWDVLNDSAYYKKLEKRYDFAEEISSIVFDKEKSETWTCSDACELLLKQQYYERVKKCLKELTKQKRSQMQFQKCKKLLGKSRRALRKGDLSACKSLSKEFKQVATLRG